MAKKAALGKGLTALMGEAESLETPKTPQEIPLKDIHRNPSQPRTRFDEEELAELADSIKQNGVLQPLLVRPKGNGYEIIAGERRYQAAKKAGLKQVPVTIREASDDEVFRLALIENLQRSDLDPIEEAQGYQTLMKREKLNQTQVAEQVSKSRAYVANAVRLLDLPPAVQEMLTDGLLTAGHARAILAVAGEDNRVRLAQRVVDNNMTVRQTETLAPLFSGNVEPPARRASSPEIFKRAARRLREALGTPVRVKQVRGKNKIEIQFEDEDELARLVQAIARLEIDDA